MTLESTAGYSAAHKLGSRLALSDWIQKCLRKIRWCYVHSLLGFS